MTNEIDYIYIRAHGRLHAQDVNTTERILNRAREQRAPKNAVYEKMSGWVTIEDFDITRGEGRDLEQIANQINFFDVGRKENVK